MRFTESCFNPYSAGNCSGRLFALFHFFVLCCVSILILLEIALEDIPEERRQLDLLMFQSLFCWKLLWKSADQNF